MGGLVYLKGSYLKGEAMEAQFRLENASLPPEERVSTYIRNLTEGGWISRRLSEVAQKVGGRWLITDYQAGNVVLHSPYTIHAALSNQDPTRAAAPEHRYSLPERARRDRYPLGQPRVARGRALKADLPNPHPLLNQPTLSRSSLPCLRGGFGGVFRSSAVAQEYIADRNYNFKNNTGVAVCGLFSSAP